MIFDRREAAIDVAFGTLLVGRLLPAELEPWACEGFDEAEHAARLGFLDALLTDDLAALERLADAVPVGLWYCRATAVPAIPEEPMLRSISAVLTPFPSLVPQMEARWPSYRGRIHVCPWLAPASDGPWPAEVGERRLEVPAPGVTVFTGAGLPSPADVDALVARGLPVVGPARGVLGDVVAQVGGALVRDRLGSGMELDELRHAVRGPMGPPQGVQSGWSEIVEAFADKLARGPALPVPMPTLLPGRQRVRVPTSVRRAAVRSVFAACGQILSFEPGEQEDHYELEVERATPEPFAYRAFRPPTVAACVILGEPRATLTEMLGSLVGAVDEVCAVFTGAPDARFVAICEALGLPARVARIDGWDGDFAAARNRSLGLANTDYALIIDDDERLVGGRSLRALVSRAVPGAVSLTIVNLLEDGRAEPQSLVRLVALGRGGRFEGVLHETFEPDSPVVRVERPFLVHYGYADRAEREQRYRGRNLVLAERHARTNPDDRRLSSVRLRDAVARVEETGQGQDVLADAVLAFDGRVVAAGAWSEYLGWAESFARALELLQRGYLWSPVLPVPNQGRHVALKLGFLELDDLRRFVAWWVERAIAAAPASRGR